MFGFGWQLFVYVFFVLGLLGVWLGVWGVVDVLGVGGVGVEVVGQDFVFVVFLVLDLLVIGQWDCYVVVEVVDVFEGVEIVVEGVVFLYQDYYVFDVFEVVMLVVCGNCQGCLDV